MHPLTAQRIRLDTARRLTIVRDDLLPGGTKRRVLPDLLQQYGRRSYVYAGPAQGYAQVALAYAAADLGHTATLFVAARKRLHPLTAEAQQAGADIVQVPYGYLNVVQARGKAWAAANDAEFLPLGFDMPGFVPALARLAQQVDAEPQQVWVAAGTGALARALQQRWPAADHHAVQVGRAADCGTATVHVAPEPFHKAARTLPPYPSAAAYDAKAWQFIKKHASDGALVWNVGA